MAPQQVAYYLRHFGAAASVLDVGCGTGSFGRHCPPPVEVHGVDIDRGALAEAAKFETVVALDVNHDPLPYEAARFDAVLVKDVLEHLHDPGRLLEELHRVLQPGGVVVASVVVSKPSRVWSDYTHVRGFTRGAARTMLEDAGFEVEALWPMGPVPLSVRAGFLRAVPYLLRVPPLGWMWTASWELRARKPD